MKISNSKKKLAEIIHENGGWRDGAESSAQCINGEISFWSNTARKDPGFDWYGHYLGEVYDIKFTGVKLANWHQTILSRTEYFHLYPAPEIAPEPVVETKPTIEQLAADYRNKLDYANRKQDEADKANMESDAALSQLEDAIAAIGFVITPLAATEKEPELVITDWRDLQVGDEIEVFNFECPEDESRRKQELMSGPRIVMQTEGGNVRIELKDNLPKRGPYWNATGVDACDFKFIRRPAKGDANA